MKSHSHSLFIFLSLHLLLIHFMQCSNGSEIKYLPGFPGPLPFHLETGYIGVDEGEDVNLFYYFVKSGGNPEKDPLILWLTGGPGCSALSGFMYEIGPLYFEEASDGNLPKLKLNPYAWTEVASILFVDLPVGTGFSYAQTQEASYSTGLQSCAQAYQFLQKWLVDHPDFASNPFYVGGDSYAGTTIPVIVQMISDGNEMQSEPQINLKGYLLGNPLTYTGENNYRIPYAHGMGLIPDELYESLRRNCRGQYIKVDPGNLLCSRDVQIFNQLVDGLNWPHILEPLCAFQSPRPLRLSEERRFMEEKQQQELHNKVSAMRCHNDRYKLAPLWTNDPSVRKALHIHEGSIGKWTRCRNIATTYTRRFWDCIPYHANLSTKGYRSLIYSGDHDYMVPYISTLGWIRSLNYSIVDEWRQWIVKGQIAGYTRTYANMTFATVKGAGHIASEYQPMECAAMFKRWISYESL